MCSHHKEMYQTNLEIAGVSIAISSFQKWKEEEEFVPFIKKVEHPDYQVAFQEVEELPDIPDSILHEDCCYRVHPDTSGGYIRSFFDAPRDLTPYAVADYEYSKGKIRIDCLRKGANCVSELHNSFFHIGFEAMLLHKQRMCIHAACVDTSLGGILFSGPSGIGKSTQAELWCRYEDARLMNGDRPILSKDESGWLAWGSPYAGSSRCHINASCKVKAIIILEQAEECNLRRMSPSEAFRAVWSGLTVHNWDRWSVEEACNLTMELIRTVLVFKFQCTPDKRAVDFLKQRL